MRGLGVRFLGFWPGGGERGKGEGGERGGKGEQGAGEKGGKGKEGKGEGVWWDRAVWNKGSNDRKVEGSKKEG